MFGAARVGNWRTNNLGLLGHYTEGREPFAPIGEQEVVNPSDMIAIGESSGLTFMRALLYDFPRLCLRHQTKVNVLLCDGHVESLKVNLLFE
jgi:prepilin-type processing-associated H-X9-DG protein